MKWDNLKNNKCPSCGCDWAKTGFIETAKALDGSGITLVCRCKFKISEKRMNEIISKGINKEIEDEYYCMCGNPKAPEHDFCKDCI